MNACRRVVIVLVCLLLPSLSGRAQGVPKAAGATPPATGATSVPVKPDARAEQAEGPRGFSYNPEGRRDPFVSLQARGADPARGAGGARAPGLAGLAVGEVTLRGTMRGPDGLFAMLQGADGKTYLVRPGAKLLDGAVRAIAPDAVVFLQEVSDPLTREKHREIRKALREMPGAR
jgi:hypothetical protein